MRAIWEELEEKIQKKYHLTEPEWVQVDVSSRGKIHVTAVTDGNVSKAELRGIVEAAIAETGESYQVGFIDAYSVEKAKELGVEKQVKVGGYSSWADALYASEEETEYDHDLQIISFYSYKGGVGRTIALIETAYNLAKQGKRVLLIDLDIEAPSLHKIFADQVNDELKGASYGMIEYLYRKVVQGRADAAVDNIYCSLELENVPGEMFLIPALKRMDKEYIYQIGRLQARKIQEQDLFTEIFAYMRRMFDIDVIMIDTRAGFNQWGSLSLLALSNQVIFVAYPNEENIEGLRAALEMVENVGTRRYVVAMSKVVASAQGEERAKDLFAQLAVGQKEWIPLYYREEIALSDRYPLVAENILSAYQELSDYILNNEKIERNRKFLADGEKEQLLKQLFVPEIRMICLFDVLKFEQQRSFVVLKYQHEEELEGLHTHIGIHYVRRDREFVSVQVCTLVEPDFENEYVSLLTKDSNDIKQTGIELISEMIKKSSVKERIALPENTVGFEEFIDALRYKADEKGIAEDSGLAYDDSVELRIIAVISITPEMLDGNTEKILDRINGLIQVFNRGTDKIQFKFLIETRLWEQYQKSFGALKGNILELRVCRDDLERLVIWNLNHEIFASYRTYLQIQKTGAREMYKIDGTFIPAKEVIETLGLVLGVRKEVKEYSASMLDYLYQFLSARPELLYTQILDCLKRAAKRELEESDDMYTDRLIGFANLQRELEKLPI